MSQSSVAVVGGGVIGLSCAWRAAVAGFAVTVHDPAPGSGASWVAGGMLAPVAEAEPGQVAALELGTASLRRWPSFAAELARHRDPGLRTDGTIVVGIDAGDRAELDRLADRLATLGRDVETLDGRTVRRLEPALGPEVRRALSVPGDLAVDNRALLDALLIACRAVGVRFVAETVTPGALPDADAVVLTAGADGGALHPAMDGLIRPVKGEILRLRARPGTVAPPSRTVRAVVGGRSCYLVPRDDGRVVLGATQYEVGPDRTVTAGGVRVLLTDAERVVPTVAEYELVEAAAGLRPATPDELPLIGRLASGVLVAMGHHRGGVLLAPVTADAVVALLRGEQPDPVVEPADPARFRAGDELETT